MEKHYICKGFVSFFDNMKIRVFSMIGLVLFVAIGCRNTTIDICPNEESSLFSGTYTGNNGEGLELKLSLRKYSDFTEVLYVSLLQGVLRPGYIDCVAGCYKEKDGLLQIYVADTLYMNGKFGDDKKQIHVSWSGSLGHMWDTCAVKYNWPHEMILVMSAE